MSKYFEKTHEEVTFEETTCSACGGTWFWSFQFIQNYHHKYDDIAIINCPYCGHEYNYYI